MGTTRRDGIVPRIAAVLLAIHFLIVLVGAFAAMPSSVLQQQIANKFIGYFQILDLGQGYRFYAPRPAPTAIITAKLRIRENDGRLRYETIRVPNRETRPRLRLQRQLALANSLWGEYERSLVIPAAAPGKSLIAQSFANHLGKGVAGCESVELFLHRHPDPQRVEEAIRRGQVLTLKDLDEESFHTPTESLGVFPCK